MEHLLAALLGVAAGTLSAMFGVGGGLIFVPTLIFLGSNTHQAVATSLAAVIGIASIPTAQLGAAVANDLSNDVLRKAFAVLLFAVAVQMGVRALRDGGPSDSPSGPDPPSA